MLYGIGVSLLYNPFIFYLDEWFVKRKGLAFGVFWAGTGFAGSVVPLILDWGLNTYGIQATLQAWAVFVVLSPNFTSSYTESKRAGMANLAWY